MASFIGIFENRMEVLKDHRKIAYGCKLRCSIYSAKVKGIFNAIVIIWYWLKEAGKTFCKFSMSRFNYSGDNV